MYSTIVNYDTPFTYKVASKTARHLVFLHNVRGDPSLLALDVAQFDIDTSVDTIFMSVVNHSLNTCILATQWSELSAYGREIWQSFAESDKAIILHALGQASNHTSGFTPTCAPASKHPSSLHSSLPSNAAVNCQLSSYLADLLFQEGNDDQVPSAKEATTSPDTSGDFSDDAFLAHVTQQKASKRTWTQPCGAVLPPSDICKVLAIDNMHSVLQADSQPLQEFVFAGKTYCAINMAHIYSMSASHCTTASGSLVNHGANSDIVGDDVQVIEMSQCTWLMVMALTTMRSSIYPLLLLEESSTLNMAQSPLSCLSTPTSVREH